MVASSGVSAHWRGLADLLAPHRRRYAVLGLVLGLASALPLVSPLIVGRVVDRAAAEAPVGELVWWAVGLVAVGLVSQAVAVGVAWFATRTAWQTTNELRLELAEHVLSLDHEFHRSHTAGELVQRIDGDVTAVSDFLAQVVVKVGGAAVTAAGMVVVLGVIDWRIGVAMALYVAAAVALVVRRRDSVVDESSDELGAYARLYGGIEERLAAAEDLRSNGGGAFAVRGFVDHSVACVGTAVARERSYLRVWREVNMGIASGGVLAIVAGAALVDQGAITVGTAVVVFQYSQLLRRPLEELMDQLQVIQKATGAMRRVLELRAERPSIVDGGETVPAPGALSVELDRVDFEYGDGEPVLTDVTLRLGAGRSLGLVGRTGSGKTTISRLVLRLIEATSGEVRLGGVALADVPLAELRRRVALVPQEVQLVAGTVRDNVTLFDDRVDDAVVLDALARVGLSRLADAGLDRELGAAGAGLSAGESQLLALARVWLRDPDVVVLDEATARVDPETEARLEAALDELVRGRTVIVIAHRLSTLRHLDEIAVVERGRIVEHDERDALEADPTTRYAALLRTGAELPELLA
ncbi:MAG: ABC transporter ATP-binding protein [Actinomycetota bacterium]